MKNIYNICPELLWSFLVNFLVRATFWAMKELFRWFVSRNRK